MTAIPPLRIHHTERPDASAVEAEREAHQRRVERDIAAAQREERRAHYEAGNRQMTRSAPTAPARDTTAAPTSTGAKIAAAVLGRQAEEDKAPDPFRDPNPPARSVGKMMGRPPSTTERELVRRKREAVFEALEERG